MRSVVAASGDTVTECSDGAEALAAYQALQPDWVLMDVEMKIMDGLEATRQIMAADPQARVLMVTQYREASIRLAAREAGARDLVTKDELWRLPAVMRLA